MHSVAKAGKLSMLSALLSCRSFDINYQPTDSETFYKKTLLRVTVESNNKRLVKFLLGSGAKQNVIDSNNKRSIDLAKTKEMRELFNSTDYDIEKLIEEQKKDDNKKNIAFSIVVVIESVIPITLVLLTKSTKGSEDRNKFLLSMALAFASIIFLMIGTYFEDCSRRIDIYYESKSMHC